jgi:hypothetical protein
MYRYFFSFLLLNVMGIQAHINSDIKKPLSIRENISSETIQIKADQKVSLHITNENASVIFYSHTQEQLKIVSSSKNSKIENKETKDIIFCHLVSEEEYTTYKVYLPLYSKQIFINGKAVQVEFANCSTNSENKKSIDIRAKKVDINVNKNLTFEKISIHSQEVNLTGNGALSTKSLHMNSEKVTSNVNVTSKEVTGNIKIVDHKVLKTNHSGRLISNQGQKPTQVSLNSKKNRKNKKRHTQKK